MDLIDTFAFRLPVTVIAELLGVPPEDQDQFREWTGAITAPPTQARLEALRRASLGLKAYIQALAEQRRAAPRDDLILSLIHI